MKPLTQLEAAEQAMSLIFSKIDTQVKKNLTQILKSFHNYRLGPHHFASVSGYGHDDLGRQVLDQVFADVMGAEAALVRVQFVSGTHAIAAALFGVLRPGDQMLSVAGAPYDTLEEVIGIRGKGQGSLKDFGVAYRQLELTPAGTIDWQALETSIQPQTRLVLIQRSCGYSWRPSLSIEEIGKIVDRIKAQNPNTICFVDNCYGNLLKTANLHLLGPI